MTVRMRNAINPQHACHSADVLTPTERAASYQALQIAPARSVEVKCRPMQWQDVPRIRKQLEAIRGTR